jgi:hypothetical protein
MAGSQIGLIIKNYHDLDYYGKIFSVISSRIESTISNYDYINSVDSIELMYSVIIPQKELTLKNISSLDIKNQFINLNKLNENFNQNLLPFTIDTSYFGKLVSESERLNYINLIESCMRLSKKEKYFKINESDQLFLYESPNKKNKIIVSKTINESNFMRYIFDLDTGILIKEIKDTIIFNSSKPVSPSVSSPSQVELVHYSKKDLIFNRSIDSVTLTIRDQRIIFIESKNKLTGIQSEIKAIKDRNINFGTFDLESFRDDDGLNKVYALGFITSIDKSPNLYYLSDYENLDSKKLILKCIDDMLLNKYNNFIFYVHNFGKYDVVFLYNVLLKANVDKGYEYYILNTIMKDNTIIRLNIKIKIKSNIIMLKILFVSTFILVTFLDYLIIKYLPGDSNVKYYYLKFRNLSSFNHILIIFITIFSLLTVLDYFNIHFLFIPEGEVENNLINFMTDNNTNNNDTHVHLKNPSANVNVNMPQFPISSMNNAVAAATSTAPAALAYTAARNIPGSPAVKIGTAAAVYSATTFGALGLSKGFNSINNNSNIKKLIEDNLNNNSNSINYDYTCFPLNIFSDPILMEKYPDFPLNILIDINGVNNIILFLLFIIINTHLADYILKFNYKQYIPNNKFGKVLEFFINRYINL